MTAPLPFPLNDGVRELNDAFRTSDIAAGQWMITRGVASFGPDFVALAARAVRAFDRFTEDTTRTVSTTWGPSRSPARRCSERSTTTIQRSASDRERLSHQQSAYAIRSCPN